jgi:hypothetical protein
VTAVSEMVCGSGQQGAEAELVLARSQPGGRARPVCALPATTRALLVQAGIGRMVEMWRNEAELDIDLSKCHVQW